MILNTLIQAEQAPPEISVLQPMQPFAKLESFTEVQQSLLLPTPAYETPQHVLSTGLTESNLDESAEPLEGSMILHRSILDTGGQPEHLNVLPALLTGPAVNVLVFKLTDSLKKHYLVRFFPPEGEPPAPYVSSYTVEEALLQAYTCISHCSPPQHSSTTVPDLPQASSCSSTLFVGTHKDLATAKEVGEANQRLQL